MKRKSMILLVMLLMVLLISLTVTAEENDLNRLINVYAGYFLPEPVVEGIIQRYPELEQIFKNALHVDPGYYMDDPTTIDLGNKIEGLVYDNAVQEEKIKTLEKVLNEERASTKKKDETNQHIIDLQDIQIQNWKDRYEQEKASKFDNMVKGAGIAAVLYLLFGPGK